MENGRYLVKTFGCKANLYDSQLIEAELQKRGWSSGGEGSSEAEDVRLCIVNSCTVTDEADRQTKRLAAKLSRLHPNAKIVITGCGAEVAPEEFAKSKGVDYVIGNRDKPGLVTRVFEAIGSDLPKGQVLGATRGYAELVSRHPMDREWPLPESSFAVPPAALRGESGRTRAFLKIQEGCNSFCTYCIIPYGRGPSRSLRPREIVEQVRTLVSEGVREVVITGTNIGDYGTDWSARPALDELLTLILAETRLERLRVSSLDPTEITPEIFALMERDPRFCPHFHVSLQSPHSRVLKLMKRRYGFDEVKRCLERIAELPAPAGGAFVGMDVITGFPGETGEEFEWTRARLAELPWSRLHVFPYSEREGTPATRLPGAVPMQERARRAKVLGELSLERLIATYQRALRSDDLLSHILVEGPVRGPDGTRNWVGGYTRNYLRVLLPGSSEKLENQLVSARANDVFVDRAAGDAMFIASQI